jgi:hypothetical protein
MYRYVEYVAEDSKPNQGALDRKGKTRRRFHRSGSISIHHAGRALNPSRHPFQNYI